MSFSAAAAVCAGDFHLLAVAGGRLLSLQSWQPVHSPHRAVRSDSRHQRLCRVQLLPPDGGGILGPKCADHQFHFLRALVPRVLF